MIRRILAILGIAENIALAVTFLTEHPFQFIREEGVLCPIQGCNFPFIPINFYYTPFLEDFLIWFSASIIALFLIDFAWGKLHRRARTETHKIEQKTLANQSETLEVNN